MEQKKALGRPRKQTHRVNMGFTVDQELKEKIFKYTADNNIPLSHYICRVLQKQPELQWGTRLTR